MEAFGSLSIDAKAVVLLTSPLILAVALYWLSLHTTSKHARHDMDTQTGAGAAGAVEDITERVPLARPEDIRGDIVVKKILIHPVKSCRGISVKEAKYLLTGLEYDRNWVIIDAEANRILTARDIPKMVLVTPEIISDSSSPYGGTLRVTLPAVEGSGNESSSFEVPLVPTATMLAGWETLKEISMLVWAGFDAYVVQAVPGSASPHELLSRFLNRRVLLAVKGPTPRACIPCANFPQLGTEAMPAHVAFQDVYPVMLVSAESLAETAARVRRATAGGVTNVAPSWATGGQELAIERFRPNILLEGAGVPFAEDAWEEISIVSPEANPTGTPTIKLVSKCTRCLLPNIDPHTATRDAAVPYKVLSKFRKGLEATFATKSCFGVNGVPADAGIVHVGDRIEIKKWYGKSG